jgi:hypothetical protein
MVVYDLGARLGIISLRYAAALLAVPKVFPFARFLVGE